jgi:hypothetical protein
VKGVTLAGWRTGPNNNLKVDVSKPVYLLMKLEILLELVLMLH